MARIVLWSESPRAYQVQAIPGCDGLPLLSDAQAAAYQAQVVCRLLGEPSPDFGAALPTERRTAIEAEVKAWLRKRRMIDSR